MRFNFFVIALIFICSNISQAEDLNRRYSIKTGKIEYKISGAENGTETLYFDNWGAIESRVTKVDVNLPDSPKTSEFKKTLLKDGKSVVVDMINNKGTVADNAAALALSGDNAPQAQMSIPTESTIKVAGEECKVWKSRQLNVETCIWNNIPLQTTSGAGETAVTKIATSINTKDTLPSEAFKLPDNAELTLINVDELFNLSNG
ncbi:MAG: hypothetical protein KDD56_04905 [Bdellovibrionales bacterium]|nr:hypothetical protein [Bdellovibrionales bacterium]